MKNKFGFVVLAMVVLAIGIVVVGCASAPEAPPVALVPALVESLRKYMAPEEQDWEGEKMYVYFLDPFQFEKFKAELDAGGEYSIVDSWTEPSEGMTYAQCAVRLNGNVELYLAREGNSGVGYIYKKETPVALGLKLKESLRKYMGPQVETWDEGNVSVYWLDPLHFEEFKAELDAWVDARDEYYQDGNWNNDNRDWAQGRTFARFVVRPDGRFDLILSKEDNSEIGYQYKKTDPK